MNLKSEINQFILSSGKFSHNKAKSHFTKNIKLMNALTNRTSYLGINVKFTERCFHVLHDLNSVPLCNMCHNHEVKYGIWSYTMTCSKECGHKLKAKNSAATMSKNGTYARIGEEHKLRMAEPVMKSKHSRALIKALNTPDITGIAPKTKAAKSLSKTLKDNPQIHKNREPKRRKTMEHSGKWITIEQMDAAIAYRLRVHAVTMSQPLNILPNFEKRGPSTKEYSDNHHIDHIFSVSEGFRLNIPPEIIGHLCNLRMIHHLENVKKNSKSDIDQYELLRRYSSYQK